MTFEEAKQLKEQLNNAVDRYSLILKNLVPEGYEAGDLIPYDFRNTPEYKKAKLNFDIAFSNLKTFNRGYTKQFKEEIKADRLKRIKQRQQGGS